jgi:alpha-galactosidase
MPKITFIGAGSTVFTKNLVGDLLSFLDLGI